LKTHKEIRLAAIDMGTNSFHARFVLVPPKGKPVLLDRTKIMVDLAPKGTAQPLDEAAMLRGIHALQTIRDEADILQMDYVSAFATSAIRDASNGDSYLNKLEEITGIRAQIISGEREGELIAKGMRQNVTLDEEIVLGVDIGGGSVEFIFMNRDKIFNIHSRKLGVARLIKDYILNDPVQPSELLELEALYMRECEAVLEDIKRYEVSKMYGSSGTLRTIFKAVNYYAEDQNAAFYVQKDFNFFYDAFIGLSLGDRMTFEGVDSARVELIVPGLQLVHFLLNRSPIEQVYYSSGALREGMIAEMLESLNEAKV